MDEVRSELKSLGDRMDRNFDKIDRKFERSDNKMDRLIYFFLGGLSLKGGFNFYVGKEAHKDRAVEENYVTKK